MAVKIVDKLPELNIAINRSRLMRKQLDHMLKVTPKERNNSTFFNQLIEGRLIQRETPSDVLRHPAGLDDTLKDFITN